ncbi:hypothetical protein RF11_00534 [Thelohanellus kitauei]|uniref:Uncharacterized protein n=1 Tax=Thelohanellus kitauei TaxID=669202 RepID=A0A0C2NL76_THEKT|nr:hypothetical protein RF11_00534 [Thelohanellus kitauei]
MHGGNYESYYYRYRNWAEVNQNDIKKRTRILLSVVSKGGYEVARSFAKHQGHEIMILEELEALLNDHVSHEPLKVAESYAFYSTSEGEGNGLNDYALVLQKLWEKCNIWGFMDRALGDKFILGIVDPANNIRPTLLVEKYLSF